MQLTTPQHITQPLKAIILSFNGLWLWPCIAFPTPTGFRIISAIKSIVRVHVILSCNVLDLTTVLIVPRRVFSELCFHSEQAW